MGDWALYRRLIGARVRGELGYRASFASFVVAQAVITSLDCVAILALFTKIHAIGGWTRSDVLYLYATATLAFGLADLFFSEVEFLPDHVREGTFDRFLLRPAPVLLQVLAAEFGLRRLGRLFQSLVVLAIVMGAGGLPIHWDGARLAVALTGLLGATFTYGSLFVLTSSLAFWSPGTRETANAFTYGGVTMAQYPTHAFGGVLRRLGLFVIPVGAVSYLPALFVLGAPNPLGVPRTIEALSPLLCIPVAAAAALVWRAGLRRYEGAGS